VKRLAGRRPDPATAIACLALFLSMGGVSYGVATGFIDSREIQDNAVRSQDVRNSSLRTQDVRNNEVRGRDIRNSTLTSADVSLNALTGADVLESSLGAVPFAARAGQADLLDGVDSTGFVRADATGPAALPLGPGGAEAEGEPAPRFDVDALGYTHLNGVVRADAAGGALAVLPLGARPAAVGRFAVFSDPQAGEPAPALVRVEPDGEIRAIGLVAAGDEVALDGIAYRAGG